MQTEYNLRIPGPVPLAPDTRDAMVQQTIDHRGADYADMLDRMTLDMRACIKTKGDVYFITSSGTGGMEAAIVNTLSAGDRVLCVSLGWFGDRFNDIAQAYGLDVDVMRYPEGRVAVVEEVRDKIRQGGKYKAVLLTHNESSTGVCNPLRELCEAIHNESDALILVDCISSTGGIELDVDGWGVDVSVSAAQKPFESPAGIAIVSFSKKAWDAYEKSNIPKYYLDLGIYKQYFAKFQPPFTPCLTSMFALEQTLQRILAEGISKSVERHRQVGELTRRGVTSIGLELLPEDPEYASDTVTAIKLPDGVDGIDLLRHLRDESRVYLGNGVGKMSGKIVRLGHMGRVSKAEINGALEALSKALNS